MTKEQTRADFEAFYKLTDKTADFQREAINGDDYYFDDEQAAWKTWQAATLKERERCEVICCNNVSIIAAIQQIRKSAPLPAQPCQNKSMGKHACTNRDQCWEPCGELGHSAEHARPSMRNFCGRCGKRLGNIDSIHTCTPPTGTQGENT